MQTPKIPRVTKKAAPSFSKPPAALPTSQYQDNVVSDFASIEAELSALQVSLIPISRIKPDPGQPRDEIDSETLSTLMQGIRSDGLQQPILVRHDENEPGHYIIIMGETRYTACRDLGKTDIPARVSSLTTKDIAKIRRLQLMENTHRSDLKPTEIARAISELASLEGTTFSQAAMNMGFSASKSTEYAALISAPKEVTDLEKRGVTKDVRGLYDLAVLHRKDPQMYRKVLEQVERQHEAGESISIRQLIKSVDRAPEGQKRAGGAARGAVKPGRLRHDEDDAPALPKVAHVVGQEFECNPVLSTKSAVSLRVGHAEGSIHINIPLAKLQELIDGMTAARDEII